MMMVVFKAKSQGCIFDCKFDQLVFKVAFVKIIAMMMVVFKAKSHGCIFDCKFNQLVFEVAFYTIP